ncbi:MAG: hypothetical protein AAGK38_13110, partial [Pseudomonadota bacterium]
PEVGFAQCLSSNKPFSNPSLPPVDFVDASNPGGGTQVRIEDKGGALFYYYDINITSLTHVNDNGINDGWDLAFFVFPTAN